MDLLEELNDLREQRQRLREQLQALIPTTVTTPSPFDFTADFSGFMSKVAANTDRNREWRRKLMQQPTITVTPLPDITQARAHLRQRVEDVSAGRAAGRFLTPADLAAALVILDHLDSQEALNRLLSTVERAATALETLVSRGGQLVTPPPDPQKAAMRRAIERYLNIEPNCDYVDGTPDVCPGIASGAGECAWCELRDSVREEPSA